MGNIYSLVKDALDSFYSTKDAKILMLGLDGAGKTTALYKLKLNETVSTVPTIGFNVETVRPTKNVSFTVWDVGGQEVLRNLWKHYFQGCNGLIFIVDSSDTNRIALAKEELEWILRDDDMNGVPLVVLANKQDLPQAIAPSDLASKLCLSGQKNRQWRVQGICATTGDGLHESIIEFSKMVRDFQTHH